MNTQVVVVSVPFERVPILWDTHQEASVDEWTQWLLGHHVGWLTILQQEKDEKQKMAKLQRAVTVMTDVERRAFFIVQHMHSDVLAHQVITAACGQAWKKARMDEMRRENVIALAQKPFHMDGQVFGTEPLYDAYTMAMNEAAYDYVIRILDRAGGMSREQLATLAVRTEDAFYPISMWIAIAYNPIRPNLPTGRLEIVTASCSSPPPLLWWMWNKKRSVDGCGLGTVHLATKKYE